jgi:hypothetical protein
VNLCQLVFPLQIASAASAIAAAGLWLAASIKKAPAPTEFTQYRMKELKGDVLKLLRRQAQAIAVQSRLNALAAACAAIAGISQLALTYLPSCWWGGR